MAVTIEKAKPDDESIFNGLIALSVDMIEEMALPGVDPDPEKVGNKIYGPIAAGLCWVARYDDQIVGALGLKEMEYEWANGTFFSDSYFYVRRDQRFGLVGMRLMAAVRKHAQKAGKHCFVARIHREQQRARSDYGIYAEVAGFSPVGHVLQVA